MSAPAADPDPPPDEETFLFETDLPSIFDSSCEVDFLSALSAPHIQVDISPTIPAPKAVVDRQSVKSAARVEMSEQELCQKEQWSTADIVEHATKDHTYSQRQNKYDLGPYIGNKSLKDIAFDELVYASMRWGVEFNWSSEEEVKGYMAHIGLIAMKTMAGLYDSEAMSTYDDNVRTLAHQEETSVFTGSIIDFKLRSVGSNTKEPEITTKEHQNLPKSNLEPKEHAERDKKSKKDIAHILYECLVCKEQFSSEKNVSDHLRTHKDNVTDDVQDDAPGDVPGDVPETTKKEKLRSVGSNTKEPEITTEEPHLHPKSDMESETSELMTEEPDRHSESDLESEEDTENTLYECSFCKERFSSMEDVCDHVHKHKDDVLDDVPDVMPDDGPETTPKEKELRELRDYKEPSFQYTYECKQCAKKLSSRNILFRHIKEIHGTTKGYQCRCDICGVKVRQRNMKNHMMRHTGEKPYKCPDCGTGFARKGTMKLHMTTHRPEKTHQCSVCGRMFKLLSTLKSHMITHTGERPYQCPQCGRRFGRLDYLKNHMRSHYRRWLDNKAESTSLSEMKETQVEKTLYACSFCQDLFDSMSDACDHMVTHKEALIQLEMTENTPVVSESQEEAVSKESPPHTCSLCGSAFGDETVLKAHMLTHDIKNPAKYVSKHVVSGIVNETQKSPEGKDDFWKRYANKQNLKWHQCTQCDKKFQFPTQLKIHMVRHTGEKAFMCSACGKQFKYAYSLKKHMKAQAEGKPCPTKPGRPKTAQTEARLMRKKSWGTCRRQPGLKSYICTVCGKHTPSPSLLERHMRMHTGEKPYQCSVCCKQFRQQSHLKRHMLFHTGKARVFPCTLCDAKYTAANSLKTHMRTHTGERPYLCTQCPAAFTALSTLKDHMITHTDERSHVCSQCGKRYKMKSSLKMHMKSHNGERPLCTVCGKEYASVNSLRDHMLIHTGERPHQCSQCGKGFLRNSALIEHMRIHTGELPFACSECGERFRQRNSLYVHKKWKHRDGKCSICSQCGRQCRDEKALEQHMTIHTGNKPHECRLCGNKFTRPLGLERHMRIHTGEKPYSCSVCGKSFREKGNMNQHMKTHTGEPVRRRKKPSQSGIQVVETSEIDALISSMVSHEEYVP